MWVSTCTPILTHNRHLNETFNMNGLPFSFSKQLKGMGREKLKQIKIHKRRLGSPILSSNTTRTILKNLNQERIGQINGSAYKFFNTNVKKINCQLKRLEKKNQMSNNLDNHCSYTLKWEPQHRNGHCWWLEWSLCWEAPSWCPVRGYPAKKAWWAPQKKLLQDLVFSTGKNKVSTIKIQCEKEGEAKDQACRQKWKSMGNDVCTIRSSHRCY